MLQAVRRRVRDVLRGTIFPEDGSRRRFRSQILPPYRRRSPNVAEVLPILYLRGLSTDAFKEGLAALLGDDASGLSPTAITSLSAAWQGDYEAFQKRDLSDRDSVYVWADGARPCRKIPIRNAPFDREAAEPG